MNNLSLRTLGNEEISQKCQIFIELLPSPWSASRNENFVNTSENLLKNKNWKTKTRFGLKCFVNDYGCLHMDMNGFRPVAASSRYILADCGWFWVVMVCLGCLQMVFGGFRWFSEICNFNSYGEIRCFKFKTSRQLWEVFVASSNNDAKVPL